VSNWLTARPFESDGLQPFYYDKMPITPYKTSANAYFLPVATARDEHLGEGGRLSAERTSNSLPMNLLSYVHLFR
jgi:hypothetical protein